MSKNFFYICDILFVMKNEYRVLGKYIKEKLHSPNFFKYYRIHREEILEVSASLNNGDRNISMNKSFFSQNSEIPLLKADDIYYLLSILKKGKSFEKKVKIINDFININIQDICELIFLLNPRKYPPVTGIVRKIVNSSSDYIEWLSLSKKFIDEFVDDYVMLHAILLYDDNNVYDDKVTGLKKTLEKSYKNENKWLTDIKRKISSLDYFETEQLKKELKIDDYHRNLIFKKNVYTVIDGSNVIYSENGRPDLIILMNLIDEIKSVGIPFYPIEIVFDENIRYILSGNQIRLLEDLLRRPNYKLFSPADIKIIQLAKKNKGLIISGDNYSEYDTGNIKIIKPEEINESYRF